MKQTLKTQKVIPETDQAVLEIVKEFAKENGLHFEVYDITSFRGRLKAKQNGVKTTPTIILGDEKIEENTPEHLRTMLQSRFSAQKL